jgi:hypothetical protein
MRRLSVTVFCLLVAGAAAGWAKADTVQLNSIFGANAVAPGGPAPWVTMTFTQSGADVLLNVKNNSTNAFISSLWFNVDTAITPTTVGVAYDSGVPNDGPILKKSTNPGGGGPNSSFRPDGDGYFDFRINWANGALSSALDATFKLSRTGGLTVAQFVDFQSETGPGGNPPGPFTGAAHMQGYGASAFVGDVAAVPLPAAAWMGMSLLGGVGGVGFFRRRRLVEA